MREIPVIPNARRPPCLKFSAEMPVNEVLWVYKVRAINPVTNVDITVRGMTVPK